MALKNHCLSQLTSTSTYNEVFDREILGRMHAFRNANPQQKIYMMAWGDTARPLPKIAVQALVATAHKLGHPKTYTGYEDITGNPVLREVICNHYYQTKLGVNLQSSEIFVSDGAQSAAANILDLFSTQNTVAVQNPTYPFFVEGHLLEGRDRIIYLYGNEQNNFVPEIPVEKVDLIYLCFPNNPTGAVATRQQLREFVDYAKSHKSIIVFDAVYSHFITNPSIPRSIYEIEGSQTCAIEINSCSKMASFTGLRLGWFVIPQQIILEDAVEGELNKMVRVRQSIKFWSASNLAQQAAIAVLSEQGQSECAEIIQYYLKNAEILRTGLESQGLQCFGGTNIPFIWVKIPEQLSSWSFFELLLHKSGVVGVPGCLFGSSGEGYFRFSTLVSRELVEAAVESICQSSVLNLDSEFTTNKRYT